MPCLLYLPSLTEEIESCQILSAAYPALISLINVRFANGKHHAARMKAFDKLIRRGIVQGYLQAGEHAQVAELLIRQMATVIKEMGVESSKFLKVYCQ